MIAGMTTGVLFFIVSEFLFLISDTDCVWGPLSFPILRVLSALSPAVKWLKRQGDHSLSSSVEIESTWKFTSTPLLGFLWY
jgi:hypothetical protein